jgi:hypothetical protein
MPTPFPGMDPYLERPRLWPGVHNLLIARLAEDLGPRLRPRYYVAVEERTYTVGPSELVFAGQPDVAAVQPSAAPAGPRVATLPAAPAAITVEVPLPDEIHETYLEVRATENHRVITALEILSPTNKRPGEGRELYLDKRQRVLGSSTHLVEIDLLRAGRRMPVYGKVPPSHYRLLISRRPRRPRADLIPFSVRQPIPSFELPLLPGDAEPAVDLNRLLHELYDRAGYDLRIDYRKDPLPSLRGEDAEWADALLQQTGLRAADTGDPS